MFKKLALFLALGILVASCDPQVTYDNCRAETDETEATCGIIAVGHMFNPSFLELIKSVHNNLMITTHVINTKWR